MLHGRLSTQIGHLLRLRVLQEIEMLAARLRYARRTDERPVPLLRRLTRSELKHIKETGIVPYPSAVALLIVPPLNKNPTTKERPIPNKTSLPDVEEAYTIPVRPTPPLSRLLPTSEHSTEGADENLIVKLPSPTVPLYNSIALFPSRLQRAALYAALSRLLSVERQVRRSSRSKLNAGSCVQGLTLEADGTQKLYTARGDQKASHAYMLCSDAGTLLRADAVPLAVALWRLRMWEGDCWEGSGRTFSGWRISPSICIQNQ